MEEITIKLADEEYEEYVRKGQSEYRMRMKKSIEDEEYVKWMFMLAKLQRSAGLMQRLLIICHTVQSNRYQEMHNAIG